MLNFAMQTAQDAGRILLEKMGRRLSVNDKSDKNIVTEADLASEKFIIEQIQNRFPRHAILAEESGSSANKDNIENNLNIGGLLIRSMAQRILLIVIRVSAFQLDLRKLMPGFSLVQFTTRRATKCLPSNAARAQL
jgi:hypothetical protein